MSKKRSAKDVELFKRNKRYNTSRTLETNKMWSQTIGHDPHANIVHDLDISVQALHGGGESEEFKNLSRLVAKSRADAAGSSAYRSEGRVWRGKKPLKGTFSVPAGYNNFDAPSVKQVSDNIVIGEAGAEEDFSDDLHSESASSSSSSSDSEDEETKMKKRLKKERKKMKKKLKKEKKKEKKKRRKEKKRMRKEMKKKKKLESENVLASQGDA